MIKNYKIKLAVRFMVSLLIIATLGSCTTNDTAILKGKVPDYQGTGYLLLIGEDGHSMNDTIPVQADGSFTYEVKGTKNATRGLYLEYLGENRSVVNCYTIPGETTEVVVKGEMQDIDMYGQVMTMYVCTPVFSGAGKKESEYLNIPLSYHYDYTYINEDGTPISFKEYLAQIEAKQNDLRNRIEGTSPEFAQEKMKEIDAIPDTDGKKFTYAWQLKANGHDASKDADFMDFVNSIDYNTVYGDEFKQSGLIHNKIRFKLATHPDLYKGKPYYTRFYSYIRDSISNTENRYKIAESEIHGVFAESGENMKEAFEIYREIAADSENFKENETTYNNLAKLLPGVMPPDFEMQNEAGDAVRFYDVIGKGKVTYIDFWATWCGPCCAEIPYMEKLAEHYKNNSKIELISISLDDNKNKWLEKLERDKPQWRQFIIPDNFNSDFAKEFNVTGIPRFMLFDADGKIIDINARRPSDDNIKEILEQHIK